MQNRSQGVEGSVSESGERVREGWRDSLKEEVLLEAFIHCLEGRKEGKLRGEREEGRKGGGRGEGGMMKKIMC